MNSFTANWGIRVVLIFAALNYGRADFIRSPFIVDGNSFDNVPFVLFSPGSSMRYQQVYRASDFGSIAAGGGWITGVSFFRVSAGALIAFIPDIEIRLSTTTRPPDGLSTIFSENIGVDERIVFPRGPLSFDGPPPIAFATPFFYEPTMGNLLLDVRNYAPATVFRYNDLEAQAVSGDSVSRVFADSVSAPSAFITDTKGLLTIFEITPIPEPGLLLFAPLGGLVLALLVRRGWKGSNSSR